MATTLTQTFCLTVQAKHRTFVVEVPLATTMAVSATIFLLGVPSVLLDAAAMKGKMVELVTFHVLGKGHEIKSFS